MPVVGVLAFHNSMLKRMEGKVHHSFVKFNFFHCGGVTLFYRIIIAEASDPCLMCFVVPVAIQDTDRLRQSSLSLCSAAECPGLAFWEKC